MGIARLNPNPKIGVDRQRKLKHQKLAAWAGISIGLAVCVHVARAGFDTYVSIDHPAIQYYKAPVDDPVYRLEKKLESGEVKLQFAGNGACLAAQPAESAGHQSGFANAGFFEDQFPGIAD